jgi:hypothetical protein
MEVRLSQNRTDGQNTGKFSKVLDPALIRFGILVPYGYKLNIQANDSIDTIIGNLKTTLSNSIKSDVYIARGQFIGPFEGVEKKKTESGTATLPYGRVVDTSKAILQWRFQFIDGGLEYFLKVQSFNGKIRQYKLLLVDQKGTVYGVRSYDPTTGVFNGQKGFELSRFHADTWDIPIQGEAQTYMVDVALKNSDEFNKDISAIECNEDLQSYFEQFAIQDITLTPDATAPITASVVKLTAMLGGVNVITDLTGLIATGAWKATNKVTGSTITITSVTASGGQLLITLDSTDTDYAAGTDAEIRIADVSALALINLKYYASNKITVTMS